jgi:predicted O-methyltransferase YrrM
MNDPNRHLRREARHLKRTATGAKAEAAAPLIRAMRSSTRRRHDPQAAAWYRLIEAERQRLRASDEVLSGGRGTTSTIGAVTRRASVPRHQAALLFDLVRNLSARRCLEMGTCVGISGAYLAAAMTTHGGGELWTLEGHRDRAEVARDTFRRLGLDDAEVVVGRFDRTLPGVLESGPFDLVFVDGHHDGDATIAYVTAIQEVCGPGALLVLDDIDWSDGMRFAWAFLRAQLSDSTVADLGRLGLIRLGAADAGLP